MARVLIALVELACVACDHGDVPADANTIDAVPRQTITDTKVLAAGMLIEGSWNAGTSDQIGLEIETTIAGFDWDIHAHANGGTQEVVSQFGQTAVTYDFRPTTKTQWYLLLRNATTATLSVDIQMSLYGQALWVGWQ